ncbi:uncharacterized protein A4U43_C07F18130 [Asparagus officinalis]|uniref:Uncharacterized protein n=2 Tax=Asparagus officinalis TaxID=4686 RepID=A0A5P1ECV2_ASPOF|nr:uncharacterized protein A4U43_C07F18130 [Asparagus officinalis]
MLLSGWTAPADKDRVVTSNGESSSIVTQETKESDEVDIVSDKHGVVGTKRKLSELAEKTENHAMEPTHCKHSAPRNEVPEDVGDNDEEDDVVTLDENPEIGRSKRLK